MGCPFCGDGAQQALPLSRPRRGNIKATIFETIERAGPQGLTVDDLERLLRLPHQSVSARVNELDRARDVVTHGQRENPSGRKAWVWIARSVELSAPAGGEGIAP